jgi:DNA-binding CsgD family transcriptional regulator
VRGLPGQHPEGAGAGAGIVGLVVALSLFINTRWRGDDDPQSVALRLVCDRELEIEKFVPREYWSLVATLATPRGDTFEARLVGADGQKIQRLDIGSGAEAEAFKRALESIAVDQVVFQHRSVRGVFPNDSDAYKAELLVRQLTSREVEVLQLLAEGRSMKEVGSVLSLTPRTVAFHKYRIMEQLKVKSTAELIQYAVKHHIV